LRISRPVRIFLEALTNILIRENVEGGEGNLRKWGYYGRNEIK